MISTVRVKSGSAFFIIEHPLPLGQFFNRIHFMRFISFLALVTMLCGVFAPPSHAQLTVIQDLAFGEFISKNNNAQYNLTVNPGGAFTFDPVGFIEINPPQSGIYDIGGFTPGESVTSVTVTQNTPLGGVGSVFQMINFQENNSASADPLGIVRVEIGATVQTSGNGIPYGDAIYAGSADIMVNF